MPALPLFDLPTALIPERLQEIAGYCGEQTALVLLLNFPGVHVRIPKKAHPTHKLAELLGMPAFLKMVEIFPDEVLQIPRAAKAIRALRNQQILRDFAAGHSQASIALNYGMTERQVNTICNTVRIDSQLDMFA
ncbi:MAG: Mor transcription activator family protein [Rhodocyclaceae bacterium]|nr:Mor transcription activator family protein [Rhodocyclaceae bacterium]